MKTDNPVKLVLHETAVIAVGQVICVAVMFGVFALLRRFDNTVLLGGALGGVLAIANFFFMAMGTSIAADKAVKQDVAGAKRVIQTSMLIRYAALIVFLFAGAKSGFCNVVALVLPLVFTRLIITVWEFFRKKGDNES